MTDCCIENCIFCKLIGTDDPNIIIHKTNEYVVIKDIKPVATCHFLLLSRKHIQSAKSLQPCEEDRNLLKSMVKAAKQILLNNGCDLDEIRMGFHWPPFYSIGHMHLHAISPVSSMSIFNRYVTFNPNLSCIFVDPEYVQKRIGCNNNNEAEDPHTVNQDQL